MRLSPMRRRRGFLYGSVAISALARREAIGLDFSSFSPISDK
jgi:hypothetical protein